MADGLRWSAPESWHITLQFLGNTPQYECIVARLRELRSPPVPIQLEGLGFFERAGVFFAGVGLTPELQALQQRVTAATGLCGFIPETRPYHPHITLARSKGKGAMGSANLKAGSIVSRDLAVLSRTSSFFMKALLDPPAHSTKSVSASVLLCGDEAHFLELREQPQ